LFLYEQLYFTEQLVATIKPMLNVCVCTLYKCKPGFFLCLAAHLFLYSPLFYFTFFPKHFVFCIFDDDDDDDEYLANFSHQYSHPAMVNLHAPDSCSYTGPVYRPAYIVNSMA